MTTTTTFPRSRTRFSAPRLREALLRQQVNERQKCELGTLIGKTGVHQRGEGIFKLPAISGYLKTFMDRRTSGSNYSKRIRFKKLFVPGISKILQGTYGLNEGTGKDPTVSGGYFDFPLKIENHGYASATTASGNISTCNKKTLGSFFSKKNQRFFLLQNFAKMTKIYSNKTKTEYSVKIFPFFSFGKMAKF